MLLQGEELYIRAFWTLHTERPTGDQTVGPIPWSKAREYATVELALDEESTVIFWQVITAMDSGFLLNLKNEHDRVIRRNKAAAAKSKKPSQNQYHR